MSCHKAFTELNEKTDLTVALAGNPNVGKSCVFNQLTGLSVVTANYPGKTVELNMGVTTFNGLKIGVVDLPGTYAIGALSDDQWVARRGVLDGRPDVVIVVIDACNLKRNLYIVLQFLELGCPLVVDLNLVDCAAKIGLKTDFEKLSHLLGVPVVPTVAVRGEGVKELVQTAIELAHGKTKTRPCKIEYSREVEGIVNRLEGAVRKYVPQVPYDLPPRAFAIQLLEGDSEFIQIVKNNRVISPEKCRGGQGHHHRLWGGRSDQTMVLELASSMIRQIEDEHGEPASVRIARERHELAGKIADEVQILNSQPVLLSEKLKHYSVAPYTGIPIMISVLLGIFAFIFYVGGLASGALNALWGSYVSPFLSWLVLSLVQNTNAAGVVLWGVDAGVLAWLSVGVPYVLTFYIVLSLLEDTGYLNSVAFLTDSIMHKVGLHGRAIIPILTGAGCNVPAIMGTRVLTTKRERILASTLIVLVPCSARTAVVLGAVASFVGPVYAVFVFAFETALIGLVGFGLHRLMPGESSGLVMEMFPFRTPSAKAVVKKTWFRFKDFALLAFPIVTLGSLAMGALYETRVLWALVNPLEPIVYGLLGLPAIVGVTLILGILRKELTLELLVALAIVQYGASAQNLLVFMTPLQILIFALIVTIYIPCIATVSVLGRELGWRTAMFIVIFTVALALVVGGVAYRVIPYVFPLR